jgi:hemerythrin-like domain-containing protein
MAIHIGPHATEPGYDNPLGLLMACHRRVEGFLADQIDVAERAAGGELSFIDRTVLENAHRYFAEAAPRHTADEELSLFPHLKLRADAPLLALAAELHAQHALAEPLHAAVNAAVAQWLAQGVLQAERVEALVRDLTALQALYHDHIAREDAELFPGAKACLLPVDLQVIGREMAARRGVDFDRWRATAAMLSDA